MYNKPYSFRPAIAMIELIFALIVMAIVMMSAPLFLSTASNSGYVAIQQEGISEAATQISIMMDYAWDENDTNESHAPVLNVSNGDTELDGGSTGILKRRAGTPIFSSRLYVSYDGSEFNASTIGYDAGETVLSDIDDIDDFNGTSTSLILSSIATTKDYIEKGGNINISRIVSYMNDNAANYRSGGTGGTLSYTPDFNISTPTTNIKHLQVTLTSSSNVNELNKTIILHAFSSNIGTYKLEERE